MARANVAPRISKHNGRIVVQLYTPHSAQKKLHKSKARFRCVAAGRRVGKTLGAVNEGSDFALNNSGVSIVWIAPVYRQCKVVYRLLKRALHEVIEYSSDSDLRIIFVNGSTWEFYSATNPDAMRGNEWDLAIFDETADIDELVWTEIVRPALLNTQGRAIFIGTPKGRNWFYHLFNRGSDPLQLDCESFTFPTSANPRIPLSEIEAAKKELPEDVFAQEFLAQFLEYGAGVIRNIEACITKEFEELDEILEGQFYIAEAPVRNHMYVCGLDVAKYQDYTVLSVLDAHTRHLAAWYRCQMIDYLRQAEKVKVVTTLYNNAYVLQDSTGVGDPVLEMMKAAGIEAEGYLFNNTSKKILVETLQVATEQVSIGFPRIPVLINEMRSIQYKLTPSRMISYEAPKGYHDDAFYSLALANYAADQGGTNIPIEAVRDAEEFDLKDYENPALYERQMRISNMLGGIPLVARMGE